MVWITGEFLLSLSLSLLEQILSLLWREGLLYILSMSFLLSVLHNIERCVASEVGASLK